MARNDMLQKWAIALAVGALAIATTACNTVRGAGEDIDSVGDAIDEEL